MKGIYVLFPLLLLSICLQSQEYISLTDGKTVRNTEEMSYTRDVEITDDGVLVTYNLGYANIAKDPIYPKATMLQMKGFGLNMTAGEPAVPGRTDSFTIPENAEVQLSLQETEFIDIPMALSPARPPLSEKTYDTYSKENVPQIRPYSGLYPATILESAGTRYYRGVAIADVSIRPLQYNYESSTVRAYSKIVYKISFVGGSKVASMKNISPDDYYLRNTTLNQGLFSQSPQKSMSSSYEVTKNYLIITVDDFLPAVNRFAEWKRLMGYNVIVASQSSWNAGQVRARAQNEYNNNTGNVYYLLLIGGHSLVPAWKFDGGCFTDYYYGCIESEYDTTQDIYVGRLPVVTTDEANTVIDKIINYEQNPVLDNNFYNTGLNCTYFQDNGRDGIEDRRFSYTTERIRNYLINQGKTVNRVYYTESTVSPTRWNINFYTTGDYLPDSLKKPTFAWDGNASGIISRINQGAFYVLHRDHGGVTEWCDPNFTLAHVAQLSNGNKLPVVFSIDCLTGQFHNSNTRCLADSLLKRQAGGAVGVFAASEDLNSTMNDALVEGMIDAIWTSPGLTQSFGTTIIPTPTNVPVYELAIVLGEGKNKMFEMLSGPLRIKTIEAFHCFGDPSMEIRTEYPTAFSNVSVTRGSNSISVSLGSDSGRITFYDTSTGTVTAYQGSTATQTCNPVNTKVCIYGHNRIPYIDEPPSNSTYYIQNETVTGNITISADVIKAGSNVTNTKPQGPVYFNGGVINLNGGTVELNGETTVTTGTTLNINNQ